MEDDVREPILCANCHRSLERKVPPPNRIMLRVNGRLEPYLPEEILCGIAANKGIVYTLNNGAEAFEYHTLKKVAERFPELLQVNRNALVRASAIDALVYRGRERYVELEGLRRVKVSRRLWTAVKIRARENPGLAKVRERGPAETTGY